ncbi:hypothetical protein F5Y17DRAFT_476093 [Xylariaceae sp. FL0594]|nr:hypothetical protein F5Y17DRAFT_476093 [Xylariaceae sp. FL0594]
MWKSLMESNLPTPTSAGDKQNSARQRLFQNDFASDASQASPKKHSGTISLRPLFDKYKPHHGIKHGSATDRLRNWRLRRPSPTPVPDPPKVKELTQSFAALRVALHQNTIADIESVREEMTRELDQTVDTSLAKFASMAEKAQELSASLFDEEVEVRISEEDGQETTTMVTEEAQAEIAKLQDELQGLVDRGIAMGDSGMSESDGEWANQDEEEAGRRSKHIVEEMEKCEDDFQEKLDEEAANVTQDFLIQ